MLPRDTVTWVELVGHATMQSSLNILLFVTLSLLSPLVESLLIPLHLIPMYILQRTVLQDTVEATGNAAVEAAGTSPECKMRKHTGPTQILPVDQFPNPIP